MRKKRPAISRKPAAKSRSGRIGWAGGLERELGTAVRDGVPALEAHPDLLRKGIGILATANLAAVRHGDGALRALEEQPFDSHLLTVSRLYRRSRELYLKAGGRFRAALVSSPRTLSSPILLEPLIEYSPTARELTWAATDPGQKNDPAHLLRLRTFSSSVFHEQSHRILWRHLPPPPPGGGQPLRRYLDFVESLVIVLDMALGDELGPALAATFYLSGVTYDPGTRVRDGLKAREYRNYLQAALHATYLGLQQYEPEVIPAAIASLFGNMPSELVERAVRRAFQLDAGFVHETNPTWQQRHSKVVQQRLACLKGKPWAPPHDPMDNREQYLFAEKWFELFGL